MKILVSAVGKIKERYFAMAQEEYIKRLSRFAQAVVFEAQEGRITDDSEALILQAVDEEGKRLIQSAKGYDYCIALSPEGKKINSLEFAHKLKEITVNGNNSLCFFVGGSYGLSKEVKNVCREVVSFSDMTFAHQLFRIMLLEQIYRAFKINANETYHK